MKVYIVTYGNYSDYSICRVFLDRIQAASYVKLMNSQNSYNDYRVEEFETSDEEFQTPAFCMEIVGTVKIEKNPKTGVYCVSKCGDAETRTISAERAKGEDLFFVGPNDSLEDIYYLTIIRNFDEKQSTPARYDVEKEKVLKIAFDKAYQIVSNIIDDVDISSAAHLAGISCILEDFGDYMADFAYHRGATLEEIERWYDPRIQNQKEEDFDD